MKGTLAERFWSKVDKTGPVLQHCPELGECWIWIGSRHERGYGVLWDGEKVVRATHVALYIHSGKWPSHHGLHKCDNPSCVRYTHLFDGTHQENMKDRDSKGHAKKPKGEHSAKAKFTQKQITKIRNLYKNKVTQKAISKLYGVDRSTIGYIVQGKHYPIEEKI